MLDSCHDCKDQPCHPRPDSPAAAIFVSNQRKFSVDNVDEEDPAGKPLCARASQPQFKSLAQNSNNSIDAAYSNFSIAPFTELCGDSTCYDPFQA